MGASKIEKFLGEAPKLATELLPDTVAQVAVNVRLSSGDLVPFYLPSISAPLTKAGTIKTIYPLNDGSGGFKWLHWTQDVDVARAQLQSDDTQRVYYTGDGEPRVTNYSMATGATGDYPQAYYSLGLPTPVTAPTATAVGFTTLTTASRSRDSGNIATVVTSAPHGLNTGAYVTMTALGGTGYNLANMQVTVVNSTTFTYYSSGAAEATTTDTAGKVDLAGTNQTRTYVYTWITAWGEESVPSSASSTIFLKEGQTVNITDLPAAWPGSYTGTYQTAGLKVRIYRTIPSSSGTNYYKVGEVDLGTTTFTDNINATTLTTLLPSLYYDKPNADMVGITSVHNGIMVGFFGNTLCFSEPGQPHAWPIKYRHQLDTDIVAVGNFGTSIIVATKGRPWLFQGNAPATMAKVRMDYILPCVSKRSLVNMGYGVCWASTGGLAIYSAQTGGEHVTKYVHSWESWRAKIDATTVVGKFYNGQYFANHSNGAFMFQKDDQVGGYLTEISQTWTAGYYDIQYAKFYYAYNGNVWLWDDPTQGLSTADWMSKTLVTKGYMNLGAARVIADYGSNPNDAIIAAQNVAQLALNQGYISGNDTGGPPVRSTYNQFPVGGSRLRAIQPTGTAIQFQLYVNKQLVYTTQLVDSSIFRLPTGYRSDTIEVRVNGNATVRAIHIAETPLGLSNA